MTYVLYTQGTTPSLAAIRVVALCLPFPLFVWAHFTAFGPVYACHLFPLDTMICVRPRLAQWTRFRPWVVNAACYLFPLIAMVPTLVVAIQWAVDTQANDSLALQYNTRASFCLFISCPTKRYRGGKRERLGGPRTIIHCATLSPRPRLLRTMVHVDLFLCLGWHRLWHLQLFIASDTAQRDAKSEGIGPNGRRH